MSLSLHKPLVWISGSHCCPKFEKLHNNPVPNSVTCTALLTCTSDVCHWAHQDPRDLILESDWWRRRVRESLWLVERGGQVTGLRAMPGTLVQGGDVTLTYARVPLSSNYASFQRLKQELTSIIKQATYYRVRFTT